MAQPVILPTADGTAASGYCGFTGTGIFPRVFRAVCGASVHIGAPDGVLEIVDQCIASGWSVASEVFQGGKPRAAPVRRNARVALRPGGAGFLRGRRRPPTFDIIAHGPKMTRRGMGVVVQNACRPQAVEMTLALGGHAPEITVPEGQRGHIG